METYGELRTLIRALQARDALSADDNDLLPSAFPLEDNLYVLIPYSLQLRMTCVLTYSLLPPFSKANQLGIVKNINTRYRRRLASLLSGLL